MNLQEIKELRDLNVELLQNTIRILHSTDDYCARYSIPTPFDQRTQDLIKKAVSIIERMNGYLPPELDTPFRHQDDLIVYNHVHK
jgi:hypothetical protein